MEIVLAMKIHTNKKEQRDMQDNYHNEQPTMMTCAMNMGVIVGAYYIGKFCLFPLSMHSTFAAMLFFGLTMMVPFLIYRLVKLYRDRYAGGSIDFVRAFSFALLIIAQRKILATPFSKIGGL